MRRLQVWLLATAFSTNALAISSADAHFVQHAGVRDFARLPVTKVLVLGNDNRRPAGEYAAAHRMEVQRLKKAHAASGIVICGDAHGAGQLTLSSDVITTAAHVFLDEYGGRRAKKCYFLAEDEGRERRVPIDMTTIVVGAERPYATKAVNDWAVAKLAQSLPEISPYDLAADLDVNETIEFVARGHSDWGGAKVMSFEDCRLRAQTDRTKGGTREFAVDCNTGDGASGGAVLLGVDRPRLGAILVGWRSENPKKIRSFSSTHYNFVVSTEGAFRRALVEAATKGKAAPPIERVEQRTASAIPKTGEKANVRPSSAGLRGAASP